MEPVTPDPKQLRKTAWILIAIMIAGGFLVLKAYNHWARKQLSGPTQVPAKVHRIVEERSLRMLRQDGSQEDLFSLRGKVVALNVVSLSQPDDSKLVEAEMQRLAEKHQDHEDFRLVTLVLDPPSEPSGLSRTLGETAAARSMSLPQWWLGTNEEKTLHKFIRSELKPSVPPERVDGKWKFDTAIVLIDRDGNLSRPKIIQRPESAASGQVYVATFDFNEAASWDALGIGTNTDLTNAAQLRKLLDETIATLLATPLRQ
ncbi:MAG: hypothetical protein V4733_00085 [Verrucomicrobiota bacterium]